MIVFQRIPSPSYTSPTPFPNTRHLPLNLFTCQMCLAPKWNIAVKRGVRACVWARACARVCVNCHTYWYFPLYPSMQRLLLSLFCFVFSLSFDILTSILWRLVCHSNVLISLVVFRDCKSFSAIHYALKSSALMVCRNCECFCLLCIDPFLAYDKRWAECLCNLIWMCILLCYLCKSIVNNLLLFCSIWYFSISLTF